MQHCFHIETVFNIDNFQPFTAQTAATIVAQITTPSQGIYQKNLLICIDQPHPGFGMHSALA